MKISETHWCFNCDGTMERLNLHRSEDALGATHPFAMHVCSSCGASHRYYDCPYFAHSVHWPDGREEFY